MYIHTKNLASREGCIGRYCRAGLGGTSCQHERGLSHLQPSPQVHMEPTYSVPSPSPQIHRAHLLSPFTFTPGTESPPSQSLHLHPRYREPTYSVPSPSPQVHRAHLLSPFTFTPGTESPPSQSLETEKFGTEQNLTPVDSK